MKYTAADGTTQRDSNDAANWTIKTKFVEREVLLDVTNFVERIMELIEEPWGEFPAFDVFEYEPESFPEINMNFAGGTEQNKLDFIADLFLMFENETDTEKRAALTEAIQKCEEINDRKREIFCYYSVNEHFADRLREHGYLVQEYGIHQIWGREAFGQSITCDSIIDKICIEMEIFEGQKYSWV